MVPFSNGKIIHYTVTVHKPTTTKKRCLLYRQVVKELYLIDVVGVGSSALQEHRRDPHVDECAMSAE